MFKIDSKFYTICKFTMDLLLLNILVLVTSIPLITIGASLASSFNTLIDIIEGDERKIIDKYMYSFKENFKKSIPITLFIFISVFFIWNLFISLPPSFASVFLIMFAGGVLISYNLFNLLIFSKFSMKTMDLFKCSFLINSSNVFKTISFPVIAYVVLVILENISLLLPIVIGISLVQYIFVYMNYNSCIGKIKTLL